MEEFNGEIITYQYISSYSFLVYLTHYYLRARKHNQTLVAQFFGFVVSSDKTKSLAWGPKFCRTVSSFRCVRRQNQVLGAEVRKHFWTRDGFTGSGGDISALTGTTCFFGFTGSEGYYGDPDKFTRNTIASL
jgi:hypothetical protein